MNAADAPINIGNTAFMLICASLVMLMTPGLAFFYGGLVGRKNVLTVMMQSFMSLSWTTVLWFAFGYSMCFGPTSAASSAIPRPMRSCAASPCRRCSPAMTPGSRWSSTSPTR